MRQIRRVAHDAGLAPDLVAELLRGRALGRWRGRHLGARRDRGLVQRGQGRSPPEDQALQQRVRGEPVGPVDAGGGGLPGGKEAGNVGPADEVRDHPADRVMGGRRDRDRLGRRIEAGLLDLDH